MNRLPPFFSFSHFIPFFGSFLWVDWAVISSDFVFDIFFFYYLFNLVTFLRGCDNLICERHVIRFVQVDVYGFQSKFDRLFHDSSKEMSPASLFVPPTKFFKFYQFKTETNILGRRVIKTSILFSTYFLTGIQARE